jgi:phosphoribosylformylglycinamidine synthase
VPEPLHRRLGLTDDEYEAVVAELGREPSELELAMYAVMWSEHCSYKSSKVHLRRLPTEAPWVLVGPGEGAGVIDIGGGWALALRIESHNHPSAVEPYQGAATGVGGIVRDVFSMGARPIALADALRFGPLRAGRNRYLCEGVVRGISGYGNAVGVPTVAGEVSFDETYADNPLVNVACIGLVRAEALVRARAGEPGNLAVLIGASTGRDGIGGASVLASAGFEDGAADLRPSVQVGDPFEEKKLIEATLALTDAGLVRGIQDLGAAGLSCAASETAAADGLGMDVDVARVHRREPAMTPVEVMTSESQERMLAIVRPDDLTEVLRTCERWEVDASVVGRVTDTGRFRVFEGTFDAIGVPGANPEPPPGDVAVPVASDRAPLADVPAGSLGDGPVYRRPLVPPADRDRRRAADPAADLARRFPPGTDLTDELLALLGDPGGADASWIWRQYDHQLFLHTVVGPGADATLLWLHEAGGRAVALSVDGHGRFCALDPRAGAALVVAEAARNLACVGAEPRALVNCLNFGDPERPEVMWQFSETVDGMAEACRALGVPVVGGNVSFYNATAGRDIDPTPVVMLVGTLDRLTERPPGVRLGDGEDIVLLGETHPELGGSAWASRHGLRGGTPPRPDLDAAGRLCAFVAAAVRDRRVRGVHDCSSGGLAVALAEMAILGGVGARVEVRDGIEAFSESANRVLCALRPERTGAFVAAAAAAGVPARVIGRAGGRRLVAEGCLDVALDEATGAWRRALPDAFEAATTL